jgi:murein DD-endopeptidase MepM/ murein hydrolase activator NlpD
MQQGYGNVVCIGHCNGRDSSVYAHLSRIDVKKGQAVAQGQTIGAVGMTGWATGPHLHFEFRVNNQQISPAIALAHQHGDTPVSAASKTAFTRLAADMQHQITAASHEAPLALE